MGLKSDEIVLKRTPWSLFDINREDGLIGVDIDPNFDIAEATGLPARSDCSSPALYACYNIPERRARISFSCWYGSDWHHTSADYDYNPSAEETNMLFAKLDAYLKETVGMTADECLKCKGKEKLRV